MSCSLPGTAKWVPLSKPWQTWLRHFAFPVVHKSNRRTLTLSCRKVEPLTRGSRFRTDTVRHLIGWFLHQWRNTQTSMMTTNSQWGNIKQSIQLAMKNPKHTKQNVWLRMFSLTQKKRFPPSKKNDQNEINKLPKWGILLDKTPTKWGWNQQDRLDNHNLYKIRAKTISS